MPYPYYQTSYPTYPPYNPYQTSPYQPAQPYAQPGQPQQTQQAQTMIPTIHADIVQVENEQAAENYPVGAGETRMMMNKTETAFFIKTALPNGQYSFDVFDKRPKAPPEPKFDPSDFVRRDELEKYVSAMIARKMPVQSETTPVPAPAPIPSRRAVKKEEVAE